MTSPVDELTTTAVSETPAAPPSMLDSQSEAFGADEERLVQMARSEALLRLARAM